MTAGAGDRGQAAAIAVAVARRSVAVRVVVDALDARPSGVAHGGQRGWVEDVEDQLPYPGDVSGCGLECAATGM